MALSFWLKVFEELFSIKVKLREASLKLEILSPFLGDFELYSIEILFASLLEKAIQPIYEFTAETSLEFIVILILYGSRCLLTIKNLFFSSLENKQICWIFSLDEGTYTSESLCWVYTSKDSRELVL